MNNEIERTHNWFRNLMIGGIIDCALLYLVYEYSDNALITRYSMIITIILIVVMVIAFLIYIYRYLYIRDNAIIKIEDLTYDKDNQIINMGEIKMELIYYSMVFLFNSTDEYVIVEDHIIDEDINEHGDDIGRSRELVILTKGDKFNDIALMTGIELPTGFNYETTSLIYSDEQITYTFTYRYKGKTCGEMIKSGVTRLSEIDDKTKIRLHETLYNEPAKLIDLKF